jgi:hypothetical protein
LNYWILFGARWTPDGLELKDPAAHACTAVATAGRLTSPISALCGSEQYLLDAPRSHACSCARHASAARISSPATTRRPWHRTCSPHGCMYIYTIHKAMLYGGKEYA